MSRTDLTHQVGFGDVATKLRERIQAAFVDLIPQEHWDEMLKKEVEAFMNPTLESVVSNGYRTGETREVPSKFSQICTAILTEFVREEAKKQFEAADRTNLSESIRAWIEENHQEVVNRFVKSLFTNGVQQISQQLSWDIANKLRQFIQNG